MLKVLLIIIFIMVCKNGLGGRVFINKAINLQFTIDFLPDWALSLLQQTAKMVLKRIDGIIGNRFLSN